MRRTEDSAHVTQRTTYDVQRTVYCTLCDMRRTVDRVHRLGAILMSCSCRSIYRVFKTLSQYSSNTHRDLPGRHCLARQGRIDFKEFAVGMSTIRKETIDQKLEMICARLEFTVQRAIVQHRIVYNATLERLWPRCIMPTCSPKHSQS